MNFLAHIHIATHCGSDIAGNLLGDFVKGNPTGRFPAEIVQGIMLHRFVDKYTDQHDVSKYAKSLFEQKLRRFAPIALDVFWDHCLARRWSEYSDLPLEHFCADAELKAQKTNLVLPEQYLYVTNLMWKNRWLVSYGDLDSIQLVLERMSHRSERMGPLADCFESIVSNYQHLSSLFEELYSDVLVESKIKSLSLE